jgi:exopolysaccharide production protein ExoQ
MNTKFRFGTLALIVFCLYIFWGSFGLDLILHPDTERMPLHRVFILLTAFIFFFNPRQVLEVCFKNKLLIILLLYVLFTTGWAYDPSSTLKNFVFLLSTMFISIMVALAYADKRITLIRWLFWLFLLLILASIYTSLHFPQIGINFVTYDKPRWLGITTNPNALGMQGLVLIWLSANLFFLSKSKLEKTIIISAITAALFAIIKADSMTSLISSVVVIIYTCYCYLFGKLSLSIKLILFTLSFLSFLFIVTFYMSTTELADTTLASTGRNTTFTGRSHIWKIALSDASNHLIFGLGFDNLQSLSIKYHMNMSHLHNGYIETLVKGGLIASIFLVLVFVKTLIHQLIIKNKNRHDFIFLNTGLIMVLLHNITESSILRGLNPLSIFMIYIIISTSLIPKFSHAKSLSSGSIV